MVSLTATVDQIRAEARTIDAGKVLLTLLVLPFFVVGFTAHWGWRGLSLVLSFVGASVKVGWQAAAPQRAEGG